MNKKMLVLIVLTLLYSRWHRLNAQWTSACYKNNGIYENGRGERDCFNTRIWSWALAVTNCSQNIACSDGS